MRTLNWLTRIAACLGCGLHVAAQTSVESRQDATRYNRLSFQGAPVVGPGSELVATTNQFRSVVALGGGVAPTNSTLFPPPAEAFSQKAQRQRLPRGSINGQLQLVQTAGRVGLPFLSRTISFQFGAIIPAPDTDEYGVHLSTVDLTRSPRTQAATPEAYWLPEPASTNSPSVTGFYWSPNARKVFAIAAGPIDVPWRRAQPGSLTSPLANVTVDRFNGVDYRIFTKRYVVSGSPVKTPRRIFWTKGDYVKSGKPVSVPSSRVKAIHIAYNRDFPETVAQAIPQASVLISDPGQRLDEKRTLWYDTATGFIEAYNKEGRVFLELVGSPTPEANRLEHLGFEIIDIFREPTPEPVTVELGDRIPAYPNNQPADSDLEPDAIQDVGLTFAYRQKRVGVDRTEFYAARETQNRNDLLVRWLESGVAGLQWPFRLSRYTLIWPSDIEKYSHYLRPAARSDAEARATAIPLPNENAPFIQYQDPLDQARGKLTDTFAYYSILTTNYPAHRALLRFTAGENVRFERVFSWLDANLKTTNFSSTVAAQLDQVQAYYRYPSELATYSQARTQFFATNTTYLSSQTRGVNGDWKLYVSTDYRSSTSAGHLGTWAIDVLTTNRLTGATSTETFSDRNGLTLAFGPLSDPKASPYPSTIPIRGITNEVLKIRVRLSTLEHSPANEVEARLVGPRGQVCTLMSDAGQFSSLKGVDLAFDDDALTPLPSEIIAGAYQPTDIEPGEDLPPGATGPMGTRLTALLESPPSLQGEPSAPVPAPWPSGPEAPTVVHETIVVGRRINAPQEALNADGSDVLVGHINPEAGDSYNVHAYRDPFTVGFTEASQGAIIPVNAIPGRNRLEAWWFRSTRLSPERIGQGFRDILWPEVLGRYTLDWPSGGKAIVLASNDGSGALPSREAQGSIYYQNDASLPGYNPNEEHALMQGGQAYALRDDLNQTRGNPTAYSSEPFVLLDYTEADGRPAMRVFPVVREDPATEQRFDYQVEAGTILQPPMPLPLLEPPFAPKYAGQPLVSLNLEIHAWNIQSASVQGPYWTLTRDTPHFLKVHDTVALQDPVTPPRPGSTVTNWLFVTQTHATNVEGILSSGRPYTLGVHAGAQPSNPQRRRFQISDTHGVSPNADVAVATPSAGLHWLATVIALDAASRSVEVDFGTTVPSPALDATRLVLRDRTESPDRFTGWRVALEPLPGHSDPQRREFYSGFTLQDRKGNRWVYRGPHQEDGTAAMTMQFYYKTLPGFFFPSVSLENQPPVGTITPYLRPPGDVPDEFLGDPIFGNANLDQAGDGNPLGIRYRAVWPANPPVLQMAESLTTPKRGLPAVRGQTSAQLLYQQSHLLRADEKSAVVLHDPTREKQYDLLDTPTSLRLRKIPSAIATSPYRGKTYFPKLPPHLADRFFLDPNRGPNGALVFRGQFVDAALGDKYLLLNVAGPSDLKTLEGLCEACGPDDKNRWSQAIHGLATSMETFVENEAVPGTFHVDTTKVPSLEVAIDELAEVENSDVAVDSYALTAVGPGSGYVSFIAGNGLAHTPDGDPVSVYVLRVSPTLYRGEVNVIESSNPLNEKLTLQQVVDLAGKTDDYRFEWKIAAPVDGLPPKVYTSESTALLTDGVWTHVPFLLPSDTAAGAEGIPTARIAAGVTTQVTPVSAIPFSSVTQDQNLFAFEVTPPHRLVPGVAVVMRRQDGTLVNGTVHGQTTATAVVVARDLNPPTPLAPDEILQLQERPVPGSPQSIVFRSLTLRPTDTYSDLWLSLQLEAGLGARVSIDGQSLVQANTGLNDTPIGTAPGNLSPLPLAYRIPIAALAGGTTLPDGMKRHLIAVELFSQAIAGASLDFHLRLEAIQSVDVTQANSWLPLDAERFEDGIRAVLGGTADVKSLADNYLIMRYQAKTNTHASWQQDPQVSTNNLGWSAWTQPQLAEGWIKRVLKGINPFNQRVTDLFNNQVNTDVSLLTQAGPRWEGDVALNLETINQAGLIEIYETVLNRGKMLSLGGGINYGPANDALLLAAGYLNDLYMLLGNEAWADAANPTIGIGTRDHTYGDIATALFSFKGQLPSLLEEELALLRGRDDFLLPGVETRPVYNRMVWNYTRGIDSGEVIYSLNYNILDQNADGRVDAADAQKLYPQGHGDAFGHYLTALKNYYQLLLDPNFDWVPRIEAVTVLGKPVSVDYQDERKFAAAAAATARAGKQIVDLTWRQQYRSAPGQGWEPFTTTKTNLSTRNVPTTRYWGVDHWASRTGQGAYLNWMVGNAILPDQDPDPNHLGSIQQVDRSTVPELKELPAIGTSLQTAIDNAEGSQTPLGLPPNSIPFDLNPLSIANGNNTAHFEQIYQRAKDALGNALVAFDDAKDVTRLMRSEEDSLADLRTEVQQQELSYKNSLIELYGTPYTDDIGPGKSYPAGYDGPDLVHPMYVDERELSFGRTLDPTQDKTWRVDIQTFTPDWLKSAKIFDGVNGAQAAETGDRISDFNFIVKARDVAVDGTEPTANYLDGRTRYVEYNLSAHGFRKPSTWAGRRASPGRIQQSISDIIQARNHAFEAFQRVDVAKNDLDWAIRGLERRIEGHSKIRDLNKTIASLDQVLQTAKVGAEVVDTILDAITHELDGGLETISTATPLSFIAGTAAGGDLSSAARSLLKANGFVAKTMVDWKKVASFSVIAALELANDSQKRFIELDIADEFWKQELRDATTEIRDKVNALQTEFTTINVALQQLDDAQRAYRSALAEGDRIQAEREVFRQRSAAIIQGFRSRDAAFRVFRSEKLERYKMLFDLAAQYTYMAAQAFDYETGLLHTQQGRDFIDRIIRSRALGVMPDGNPQFAGSNTGDPGLSSIMAEMNADWSVLRTRLGFKNPDAYGTTASLRSEHFRILPGSDGDAAWIDQLNAGRKDNLLEDPDVRRYCMQIDPKNGLPVPGIILEFSTTIAEGLNLFGRPLGPKDHAFSPASFATKIFGVGVALEGYSGMEAPSPLGSSVEAAHGESPAEPDLGFLDPDAMSANPYVYLIPVGLDSMRSPPLGDTSTIRTWSVEDIAIPLPFNIGGSEHSTAKLWQSADSLSEPLFSIRKHQPFRPVPSSSHFDDLVVYWTGGELERTQFNNTRLLGRSVWNSRWKLVIPGRTLLSDPHDGLDRFIRGVKDVRLYFMTYSYSGN